VIIPSIDLMAGQTVQLVGGARKELDAGDPIPIAERFRVAGEIAVVDLDAAMGTGSNEALVRSLLRVAPCRVGGGIRDAQTALRWLDEGASKVVIGTAARPDVLCALPHARVIAALDAVDGEIVVEGWKTRTGRGIIERMKELKDLVGGFLVTFVEREGRLGGTAMEQVQTLVHAAAPAHVTIAGGVTTTDEIAELDRLGADAQVGMALYTSRMELADAIVAPLQSDRSDGLYATVVTDERGVALGLAWSDEESVREAVRTGRGVYHSRKRGLWIKGETSGAIQELLRIDLDCDRDAMRFVVRQHGEGFCHSGTRTCWGPEHGLGALERTLHERKVHPASGSYTRRLLEDAELLSSKLKEEAGELAAASTPDEVAWEAADLLYFIMVAAVKAGVPFSAIEQNLDRKALKVVRRPGDAKPQGETP
jgi:phosphoribosyl-AMP cyclohydrolase / phosphoribosyl-ATP pyrophosphohydrolase